MGGDEFMSWKKQPYKPPSEVNDNIYMPDKKEGEAR